MVPPNHPMFNRGFPLFSPSILGEKTLFLGKHPYMYTKNNRENSKNTFQIRTTQSLSFPMENFEKLSSTDQSFHPSLGFRARMRCRRVISGIHFFTEITPRRKWVFRSSFWSAHFFSEKCIYFLVVAVTWEAKHHNTYSFLWSLLYKVSTNSSLAGDRRVESVLFCFF